ncbi:phage tail protein I, partial [Zymomonas mobilis]|uniref:phage tail protein I n=1 Tax=Zymomonas mobilis TaxID=542 RepID=UPI0039EAE812
MTTLLPPNATALEKSLETVKSEAFDLPVNIPALWNPQKCPLELLPYLAWSIGLDSWSDSWPENVRRARVAAAIEIARHKGTAKSVRDVVASFGGDVVLREWWQVTPQKQPHTFDLVITIDSQTTQAPTAAFVNA